MYVLLGRAVTEYSWGGSRNILFIRHKSLVLTVKNFLQSVYIYGSYRKIKTGVPFFLDHPVLLSLLIGPLSKTDQRTPRLTKSVSWRSTACDSKFALTNALPLTQNGITLLFHSVFTVCVSYHNEFATASPIHIRIAHRGQGKITGFKLCIIA